MKKAVTSHLTNGGISIVVRPMKESDVAFDEEVLFGIRHQTDSGFPFFRQPELLVRIISVTVEDDLVMNTKSVGVFFYLTLKMRFFILH